MYIKLNTNFHLHAFIQFQYRVNFLKINLDKTIAAMHLIMNRIILHFCI